MSAILRVKSLAELPESIRRLNAVPGSVITLAAKLPRFLNQRVEFDGHHFDSKSELNRYMTLKGMAQAGLIQHLRVHPVYALNAPNGALVGDYIADFDYLQEEKLVVEDCKSPRTAQLPVYRWKRRHLWLQYGIEIRDIVKRWKRREARTT